MRMYDIITNKRDGKVLTKDEIEFFVFGFTKGEIPEYQASALLMAAYLRGLSDEETAILTDAMANSGDKIDLSEIDGFKIDKHSTGGVGDKTTLIVGPIVAACGVKVAKMSGKGLGHTGGTVDKLESIPGFSTSISMEHFVNNVKNVGISVAGQTGKLAPADKKMYALRDVTATIDSMPLIAASIMSKKLAAGADGIVLDVKTGSGAFMKTIEDSKKLAEAMVEIGNRNGKRMAAIVTDMDIPLGNAIGNSLEIIEAIETLKGKGPEDLNEVCIALAVKMLCLAGFGSNIACLEAVKGVISNGKALEKLGEMIEIQGGDKQILQDYSLLGIADVKYEIKVKQSGYINKIQTEGVGKASVLLGAGREKLDNIIDYTAGIILSKKTGDLVKEGDTIATFYSSSLDKCISTEKEFLNSIEISQNPPQKRPLILAEV